MTSLVKRARIESDDEDSTLQQIVVASDGNKAKGALIQSIKRTSGLQAPVMCLRGHQAEILDLKFSPDGDSLASSSSDKTILLWKVYGDCENYGIVPLKNAATSIAFVGSDHLVAGCTDNTLLLLDLNTGKTLRRFKGHSDIVNSVDTFTQGEVTFVASASDDGSVRIWRTDSGKEIEEIEFGYPVTSIKFSADGQSVFAGGIDNDIHVYSLAENSITYSLQGHLDTVTSLSLEPGVSNRLLSVGMDSIVKIWSVEPFAPAINAADPALHPRLVRSFEGAPAGFENLLRKASWSRHESELLPGARGTLIACGGADRSLTIWDTRSGDILYKLPGHTGTVIATDWSPREPIVASGGVEGVIYLGEVEAR